MLHKLLRLSFPQHSPLNEHTAGTLPHDAAPQQLKTVAQHEEVACILQVDSMMDSNIAEGKISSGTLYQNCNIVRLLTVVRPFNAPHSRFRQSG